MKHSDPLVKHIKQTLDQQTVDKNTSRQLAVARDRALHQSQPFWRISYAIPAIAMASLIAIVVIINQQLPGQTADFSADSIETFEIISSNDEFEMLENLEFYMWLDQQSGKAEKI